MALCAVKNERKLLYWINKLERLGIRCIVWREPDMDNEITAIATEAIPEDERRCLRDLQLLKAPILQGDNDVN